MSLRRLQPPPPMNVTDYTLLGKSIVTTLAMLPSYQQSSFGTPAREGASMGESTLSSVRVDQSLPNVQNSFVSSHKDEAPEIPLPETWPQHPNAKAVRDVLEAYERGFELEALIAESFPEGDFRSHLFAYLRDNIQFYKYLQKGTLEAKLMEFYVTGPGVMRYGE
eukprot:Blabericola_migrator_1__4793@NODE_2519_length_2653_cov_12_921114_g1575_i0_p3_GENE_NODE_2519_length_2653_cov_12_921114_g1575_i0NODE_2519_length_2653_cov_12_921114_g1575_i0_p3_ORF_typecomplete_len165_score26_78FMOlike/PF00743_19/0_11_NODE_2519_length_2653_cov_12_921114_g1575_i020642558